MRVSELCGLLGHDADLAAWTVRVRREITKTDAGERSIPMLPAARSAMIDHKARRPCGPGDPIFATRNGRPNTPANVLCTVLGPVHERANELLAAQDLPPIAHLTPHTLRRTFASILGVCRVDTRRAVALLGHTDARMTFGVYAQLLKLGHGNVEALEQVMGCTRDQARAIFESEAPGAPIPNHLRTRRDKAIGVPGAGRRRPAGSRSYAGHSIKRLKGLEPSTFCMASRRSSQLSYSRARRRV